MNEAQDVVIIGAGLAGLTAARELTRAGASALVLEARDRVGGRTLSQKLDGHWVDLGGQWIGPDQHRMTRLVRELDVPTFRTFSHGKKVMDLRGSISTYAGAIPSLSPVSLLVLNHVLGRVERLRARVPKDRPFDAAGAEELDAITLAAWERWAIPSRTVRDLFDAAVRVVFGAEPSELSLLHFLFYANSGEGLMHLIEIDGGAQQDRLRDGAQTIAVRLAEELGDRVVLSAPARRVDQDGQGVVVTTDRGTYRARRAIIAIPPTLAGRITYEPALPAARDGLTQRLAMGATIKFIAAYEAPFWRDRGLSGEAVCTGGPIAVTFDNSPADGSRGALVAFLVGRAAREWGARPAGERRRAVLDALVRLFGPRAAEPLDCIELDWSAEPFTRGCPTGTMSPGTLTLFGRALREPVGLLHWAGTETAVEYTGYMEGAVESGERAAREVLSALASPARRALG